MLYFRNKQAFSPETLLIPAALGAGGAAFGGLKGLAHSGIYNALATAANEDNTDPEYHANPSKAGRSALTGAGIGGINGLLLGALVAAARSGKRASAKPYHTKSALDPTVQKILAGLGITAAGAGIGGLGGLMHTGGYNLLTSNEKPEEKLDYGLGAFTGGTIGGGVALGKYLASLLRGH